MHTDPISDLLTRIRNAQKAHHQVVHAPHSRVKEDILKILKNWGFIEQYELKEEKPHNMLKITLKEDKKLTLKKVSKPGQRIYIKKKDIRYIKNGLGISILSTSKGLMTNVEAVKQNTGGELLCEIY